MASHSPGVLCRPFKFILEYSGVRKVACRTYSDAGVEVRIGFSDGYTWHIGKVKDVHSIISVGVFVRCMRECLFTNEAKSVCPHRVRGNNSGVFEGKGLRSGAQSLRKVPDLADCERCKGGIILKVIFACEPVLGAEVVVDISIDLIGAKSRIWSDNESVISERLVDVGVFRGNEELTVGQL